MRYRPEEFILSFDWLNDDLSDDHIFHFGTAHYTARDHLRGYSLEQIRAGFPVLRKLHQIASRRHDLEFQRRYAENPDHLDGRPYGQAQEFETLVGDASVLKGTHLENFTWPAIFSLLALEIIGCQIYLENHWELFDDPFDFVDNTPPASKLDGRPDALVEAMDACRVADLIAQANVAKQARQAASAAGGKAKAAHLDPLKAKICDLDDAEYSDYSVLQAAKRIYWQLMPEIDAALTAEDPQKRVEKWIGAHRKEKRNHNTS